MPSGCRILRQIKPTRPLAACLHTISAAGSRSYPQGTHPVPQKAQDARQRASPRRTTGFKALTRGQKRAVKSIFMVGFGWFCWWNNQQLHRIHHFSQITRKDTLRKIPVATEEIPKVKVECCPECNTDAKGGIGLAQGWTALPTTPYVASAFKRHSMKVFWPSSYIPK